MTDNINYKYSEADILKEVGEYVASTYSQHYSGEIQTVEYIMANSNSFDFLTGSVQAYIARYGRKEGHNRKDILKAIHFCLMILHYTDKKNAEDTKIVEELDKYVTSMNNEVPTVNISDAQLDLWNAPKGELAYDAYVDYQKHLHTDPEPDIVAAGIANAAKYISTNASKWNEADKHYKQGIDSLVGGIRAMAAKNTVKKSLSKTPDEKFIATGIDKSDKTNYNFELIESENIPEFFHTFLRK